MEIPDRPRAIADLEPGSEDETEERRVYSIPEGPTAIRVIEAAVSCSRQIVRKIDRTLADEELTFAQWWALRDIDLCRGWTYAAWIARRTGVSRQAATALLARLDERGFLTWRDDDWVKSVRLTQAGEDAVRRGWSALAHIRDAIDRLSLEDRRGIVSADDRLRHVLMYRPPEQPWYWEYLPAHLRKSHVPVWEKW